MNIVIEVCCIRLVTSRSGNRVYEIFAKVGDDLTGCVPYAADSIVWPPHRGIWYAVAYGYRRYEVDRVAEMLLREKTSVEWPIKKQS